MPTEQNKPNFARVISKQKKAKNKQKENRDKIINQKENKSITSQESDGERPKRALIKIRSFTLHPAPPEQPNSKKKRCTQNQPCAKKKGIEANAQRMTFTQAN